MNEQPEAGDDEVLPAQELWLGYDGLLVPFRLISALLVYQPVWDRRIVQDYGRVPSDVQSVVLLTDGRVLPARRTLADLRERWSVWQRAASAQSPRAAERESPSSHASDDSGSPAPDEH